MMLPCWDSTLHIELSKPLPDNCKGKVPSILSVFNKCTQCLCLVLWEIIKYVSITKFWLNNHSSLYKWQININHVLGAMQVVVLSIETLFPHIDNSLFFKSTQTNKFWRAIMFPFEFWDTLVLYFNMSFLYFQDPSITIALCCP